MKEKLALKCKSYLQKLCNDISDRSVGSEGNLNSTKLVADEFSSLGWNIDSAEFDAIDWKNGGAVLMHGQENFDVQVSPYSKGCSVTAPLAEAKNIDELEKGDFRDKIILLHGEIAREQLMPKNFVFYNPEEHQRIIAVLEKSGVKAIVCATGRNAALAGGIYPFPLIEDGDFDIPSVYMTEEEGEKLRNYIGREVILRSDSERIPSKAYNVLGRKGYNPNKKIVITAHIDAKKGSPGAIDNATGVIVLLLLADLLKDYSGSKEIELLAFNGEDYYSVPGQMNYIASRKGNFDDILLNINIDGAGYKEGPSAFSFYGLTDEQKEAAMEGVRNFSGIKEGAQWPQGDHSIFIQYGRPAIAISSDWFIENIETQDITHTTKDHPGIVDCSRIAEISLAVEELIRRL